eukprot:728903-Rhodomonas_salina.1
MAWVDARTSSAGNSTKDSCAFVSCDGRTIWRTVKLFQREPGRTQDQVVRVDGQGLEGEVCLVCSVDLERDRLCLVLHRKQLTVGQACS